MTPHSTSTETMTTAMYTDAAWPALHSLRIRYQEDRDLFSNQERERLRFVRWLYRTSRLLP
jgi:hypothetical protein